MLVFWKERLVFFAVPKTGTTALEGALAPRATMIFRDPPVLKHIPVYRFERLVIPLLDKAGRVDDLETIAVVRNPIDWLGSWYRYRSRDDLAGHKNSTRGISFDDFVLEYTKGKPEAFANIGSQSKFLLDSNKVVGVHHLFRYEAMPKLVAFFEEKLAMKITLGHLNVSPSQELTLSPDVQARFEQKCALEFSVWEQGIA